MHWNSVAEFFAMGGYAVYVWPSFGACALLMLVETIQVKHRYQAAVESCRRQFATDQLDKKTL